MCTFYCKTTFFTWTVLLFYCTFMRFNSILFNSILINLIQFVSFHFIFLFDAAAAAAAVAVYCVLFFIFFFRICWARQSHWINAMLCYDSSEVYPSLRIFIWDAVIWLGSSCNSGNLIRIDRFTSWHWLFGGSVGWLVGWAVCCLGHMVVNFFYCEAHQRNLPTIWTFFFFVSCKNRNSQRRYILRVL